MGTEWNRQVAKNAANGDKREGDPPQRTAERNVAPWRGHAPKSARRMSLIWSRRWGDSLVAASQMIGSSMLKYAYSFSRRIENLRG